MKRLTAFAALLALAPAGAFAQQEVRVLELKFFPPDSSGDRLDTSIRHVPDFSIGEARRRVAGLSSGLAQALDAGSAYLGSPGPALSYRVVESVEHLEPVPAGFNNFEILGTAYGGSRLLGGRHVCDYVDGMGVREVWIWAWHFDGAGAESNMSMGTASRAHFNHGGYGDISNSNEADDLPVCRNTYTVYDYNYARGVGEALENHGHQLERLFEWVDLRVYGSRFLTWGRVGEARDWAARPGAHKTAIHCGNVHYPPNGTTDYDWSNRTVVLAACDEWPGDASPASPARPLSCEEWGCGGPGEDGGAGYKLWLMRRYPGLDNPVTVGGRKMRNWWEFVADFDAAAARGRSFFEDGLGLVEKKRVAWYDGGWRAGTLTLTEGEPPTFVDNLGRPASPPASGWLWWVDEGRWVLGRLEGARLAVYWRSNAEG